MQGQVAAGSTEPPDPCPPLIPPVFPDILAPNPPGAAARLTNCLPKDGRAAGRESSGLLLTLAGGCSFLLGFVLPEFIAGRFPLSKFPLSQA